MFPQFFDGLTKRPTLGIKSCRKVVFVQKGTFLQPFCNLSATFQMNKSEPFESCAKRIVDPYSSHLGLLEGKSPKPGATKIFFGLAERGVPFCCRKHLSAPFLHTFLHYDRSHQYSAIKRGDRAGNRTRDSLRTRREIYRYTTRPMGNRRAVSVMCRKGCRKAAERVQKGCRKV